MMRASGPRWYHLFEQATGEQMAGKVYVSVEFIDANQKRPPIFKIAKMANPFFLYLLTIGVRSMKSALGVHKPQIVYTAPLGGGTEKTRTELSSNPSGPRTPTFW